MRTILASVDLSATTGSVVGAARRLGGGFPSRIVLLHVVTVPLYVGTYTPTVNQEALDDDLRARRSLQQIIEGLRREHFKCEAEIRFGEPGPRIVEEAIAKDAEYIVLGAQGHGLLHQLLVGSTTVHALRHAPCAVLVVPASSHLPATGAEVGAPAEVGVHAGEPPV